MNAKKIIAVALFVSTGTAFAAEAPAAASNAVAGASAGAKMGASAESATATASKLNLPALGAPSQAARDGVKAEARDALSHHKTTLAVQLDQYKN